MEELKQLVMAEFERMGYEESDSGTTTRPCAAVHELLFLLQRFETSVDDTATADSCWELWNQGSVTVLRPLHGASFSDTSFSERVCGLLGSIAIENASLLLRGVALFRCERQDPVSQLMQKNLAISDTVRQLMLERIVLPIRFPQYFSGFRSAPRLTTLLFGPRGCGKRTLVAAVAAEAGMAHLEMDFQKAISCSKSSDRLVKLVFLSAKAHRPCILEIHGLETFHRTTKTMTGAEDLEKRRCLTEFVLQCQELTNSGAMLIGVSDDPWLIDPWLRRRFEKRVLVGLPDRDTRAKLLGTSNDVLLNETQGLTLAELSAAITNHEHSFATLPRSVTSQAMAHYSSWADEFS